MEKEKYIKEINCGNVSIVENASYQWAVIDKEGDVIVPFGKYGWIDRFDSGLARVRTPKEYSANAVYILTKEDGVISGKENIQQYVDRDKAKHPEKYAKWGIINEKGEEVLPVVYDSVWNFKGKNRYSVRVEKDGFSEEVFFHDLNPSLPRRGVKHVERNNYDDNCFVQDDHEDSYLDHYGEHYGDFAGSYAQDVMGFSDDVIYDAFEGDPDAYWNID